MTLNLCDKFSIDINVYLNVADHKPDYSQDYIQPSPEVIRRIVDEVKLRLLENFISSLEKRSRVNLLRQIESLTPVHTPLRKKPSTLADDNALRSVTQVREFHYSNLNVFIFSTFLSPSDRPWRPNGAWSFVRSMTDRVLLNKWNPFFFRRTSFYFRFNLKALSIECNG